MTSDLPTPLPTPPNSALDQCLEPASTSPSTNPLKRKRSLPPSPPTGPNDPDSASDALLSRAVHVLTTAASALSFTTRLYQTDPSARASLVSAVDTVVHAHRAGGKLVICGVGKSGLVGRKLTATLKSLGIGAAFLHAADAVHGDLGDVRANDALLCITYSARTEELLRLAEHVPDEVPVLLLTGQTDGTAVPLFEGREVVLLPAPVHEVEEQSFGVGAPTTSTTVAMAVGDMLALTVAEKLHGDGVAEKFKRNHPGGAIGEKVKRKLRG